MKKVYITILFIFISIISSQAHENENYRKLVYNSIVWTAEQE